MHHDTLAIGRGDPELVVGDRQRGVPVGRLHGAEHDGPWPAHAINELCGGRRVPQFEFWHQLIQSKHVVQP